MGADAVVGNSQRFGVPLGYGGPHAAFLRDARVVRPPGAGPHHRHVGRRDGPTRRCAWRCRRASSTSAARRRRRTSAPRRRCSPTSRRCTRCSTARQGLRAIAERVHNLARVTEDALRALGLTQTNAPYFDTLRIEGRGRRRRPQGGGSRRHQLPLRRRRDRHLARRDDDDRRRPRHRRRSSRARRGRPGTPIFKHPVPFALKAPPALQRTSAYLTHPVFNSHHSETKMMRYIRSLERKDVGLDTSMIPLGSCTMKLNAASEMIPVTLAGVLADASVRAGRAGAGLRAGLPTSSRRRSAGSPALRPCRCSRTPARRGSSPG